MVAGYSSSDASGRRGHPRPLSSVLTYAAKVVVILMDAARAVRVAVGQALADELGWPLTEGDGPGALHAFVTHTLGRREHLVIATAQLAAEDQQIVRGDRRGVRFVDLAAPGQPRDAIVAWIRREFGV